MMFLSLFFITALCSCLALGQKCDSVDFGKGSVVCRCNSTYCDFYPDPEPPIRGKYVWYVTSKAGKRLERNDGAMSSMPGENHIKIKIDMAKKYQTIEGFGGSFTDSASINIMNLSSSAQRNLMRSYFSSDGSKYSLARVPIAGTDFSTRGYTYDDTNGDSTLSKFKLAMEDTEYKIPLMKQARKLNPQLRFVSAAWTAPPWMKTQYSFVGISSLQEKYYQTFADYIVKFLEEYKNQGLDMWAVSTGNEPYSATTNVISPINAMYWPFEEVAKWLVDNLGPSVQKSSSNNTSILALDDGRMYITWYMDAVKATNKKALDYIKGIAIHWYFDAMAPSSVLELTHKEYPDQFMLMTESCVGFITWSEPKVVLGSWSRTENLLGRMFENLNHWVVGWIDWNLALNSQGGPNWVGNFVDSSIIVLAKSDVFYKQPYFYAIAHFSKFVPRNSIRIGAKSNDTTILTLAFETKDHQRVVLLYNKNDKPKNVSIADGNSYVNIELPKKSLHTILYKC